MSLNHGGLSKGRTPTCPVAAYTSAIILRKTTIPRHLIKGTGLALQEGKKGDVKMTASGFV
jgi:hypothetical protein